MTTITLPAPVKINLFLRVLGRRADGYHELQTLFQLLDAGDELTFTTRGDGSLEFRCSDPGLENASNLVIRAARLLQERTTGGVGADIVLNKTMPVGGGIGGGSSDAATTLLALNQLWNVGLSTAQLAELGRALGADIPVFIHGHSAFAEGVGEKLQAIDLPEVWYVVLTPKVQVSTAAVFAHPQLTRDSAAITVAAFFGQGTPTQLADLNSNPEWRNDCQSLVATLYPEVAAVIEWLSQHAPAKMTGTGASVFAPFATEAQARQVLAKSPWLGFVARGINQSPVHEILKELNDL